MKQLCSALAIIFVCHVAVADQNDFRCLKSIGLKNPLRLQFVFRTDKQDVGYVIYQHGSGPIPIKKLTEKVLKSVPGGRPSAFESRWAETLADGTDGIYVVLSQGALIYDFRYLRKKDGKIFQFEEDLDASTEQGCEWNTR